MRMLLLGLGLGWGLPVFAQDEATTDAADERVISESPVP